MRIARMLLALAVALCAVPHARSQTLPAESPPSRTQLINLSCNPYETDRPVSDPNTCLFASDFGLIMPGRGLLFDRLRGGLSTGVGLSIPISSPTDSTCEDDDVTWHFIANYRYTWLRRRNVQLTQSGVGSFDINHGSFHLGEVGLERTNWFSVPFFDYPKNQRRLFATLGIRAELGGAATRIDPAPFDAAKKQIVVQRVPGDCDIAGGYELYAKVGYVFFNGAEFGIRIGYGQLFTGLLQDEASSNSYVPLIFSLDIPLPSSREVSRRDHRHTLFDR